MVLVKVLDSYSGIGIGYVTLRKFLFNLVIVRERVYGVGFQSRMEGKVGKEDFKTSKGE